MGIQALTNPKRMPPATSADQSVKAESARVLPIIVGTTRDIRIGSVLLRPDVKLPQWMKAERQRIGRWNLIVGLDGMEFERLARAAGWHFSFVIPGKRAVAWGFHRHKVLASAVLNVLRKGAQVDFNGLEITKINAKRYLGLYRVEVAAHPRQLQKNPYLGGLDRYHWTRGVWDSRRLFHARNQKVRQIKGI